MSGGCGFCSHQGSVFFVYVKCGGFSFCCCFVFFFFGGALRFSFCLVTEDMLRIGA